MLLSPIFIFAAVSIFSAAGIALLLTRKWWGLKNLRVSFPDIGESAVSVFLKKSFGNAKLEKRFSLLWKRTEAIIFQFFVYFKKSRIVAKIKEKTDHILGKSRVIPERETSSVFLKSIAEHKKKTQEGKGE